MRPFFLGIICVLSLLSQASLKADFTSDVVSGCSPVTISFRNLSTGNNLRYLWSFGNGNVSTKENPQAIYYSPGKYTVSLTITDPNGNKSSEEKVDHIVVFKNPQANFTASPLSGCAPLEVVFSNKTVKGDADIKTSHWDFGDGNTVKVDNPTHVYKDGGKFTVSLLVTDYNNCQSEKIESKYIDVKAKPTMDIKASQQFSCEAPLEVEFTDQTSNAASGSTYKWDFGDGTTSTQRNPQHTYEEIGLYNVTLYITSPNGCVFSQVFSKFINVGILDLSFTESKKNICAPGKVLFVNTSLPKGMITSWDFGDGQSANGLSVEHEYTTSGTFDVTMKVKTSDNCQDELVKTNLINVSIAPVAKLSVNDSSSCNTPFLLLSTSNSSNATRISHYLNDTVFGHNSTSSKLITTYGRHDLKLVVKNSKGCADSVTMPIVIEKPIIYLMADVYEGCAPLDVEFWITHDYESKISKQTIEISETIRYESDSSQVNHTFQDTGVFDIVAHVTFENGCTTTDTLKSIEVGMKSNPDFNFEVDSICPNTPIFIKNETEEPPDLDMTRWSVFQGSANKVKGAEQFNGKSNYDEDEHDLHQGWHHIGLITTHNGCHDTFIKENRIFVHYPEAAISNSTFDSCDFNDIELTNVSVGADSSVWFVHYIGTEYDKDLITKIDTFYSEKVIIYADASALKICVKLWCYNVASNCVDTDTFCVNVPIRLGHQIVRKGDLCSPAHLSFSTNETFNDDVYTLLWYVGNSPDGTSTDYSEETKEFRTSFEQPGTYDVMLRAIDVNGCYHDIYDSFDITGPEVAGEFEAESGCPPLPIKFRCTEFDKDNTQTYWMFDGRSIEVTDNSWHTDSLYSIGADSGISRIYLTSKDSNGCTASQPFSVKVEGPFESHLKIRRFQSCKSNRFIFSAEVPPEDTAGVSYMWDLGNGETSTENIVNAYYDSVGTYPISVEVDQGNGCKFVLRDTIDLVKENLHADFTATNPDIDCPPVFVEFFNKSTATARRIKSYMWDFGDGSTSSEKDPSKLYLIAGKYTVKLFVEDEWGCKDSMIAPDFVIVNGPVGRYEFDKKSGCVPLTVRFTSETERTSEYEWDLGDGTVLEDSASFSYTYTIPGRFIPLLILSDSFGCTYTLPPIDTIIVEDYPKIDFEYDVTCYDHSTSFKAINSANIQDPYFVWYFEQGSQIDSLMGDEVSYTFKDTLPPKVTLKAETEQGCDAYVSKQIKQYNLVANLKKRDYYNCINDQLFVLNNSYGDTTLTHQVWEIEGEEYTSDTAIYFPTSTGKLKIQLIQFNVLGCSDTLIDSTIVIGDSVAPPYPEMLRASVINDDWVELDYVKSPLEDFKAYLVYHVKQDGHHLLDSLSDRDEIHFEHSVNTLDSPNCYLLEVQNACGLISASDSSSIHCVIETKAVGDTNRNLIRWTPYMGWDSVSVYEIFRKETLEEEDFELIGTVEGSALTYVDSLLYCNVEYDYRIQGVEHHGNLQVSWSDTARAIPEWDYTPPPNKLVRATVDDDIEVRVEWDSSNSVIPIKEYVVEKSKNGLYYQNFGHFGPDEFFSIDQEVYVDDYSYFYRTYAIDECDDTSNIWNFGKTILLQADTSSDQRPFISWSFYQGWTEPVVNYLLQIENPDGSFSDIALLNALDSNFIDWFTDLNQRPDYCYRVVAFKEEVVDEQQVISISNVDCSPVRSYIFYPNAFSPNGDHLNDVFNTPGRYIKEYHIQIFNRWGELVFESFDFNHSWDGTYEGKPAQQDAYAVIVKTTGVDLVRRIHMGTITLVR